MSTVAEIESAIEKLSPDEKKQLRERLLATAAPEVSVMEKLRRMAGKANGLPRDMARNHDHYLHGVPKRVD